ncbi:type II toxin-antitoxin system RelE/ParE family toxin [Flavisolibacter sp. BT320]|nr:type II toxin-antitoxin system RelE/ParE family toxin [Flavisolibacter longurius]
MAQVKWTEQALKDVEEIGQYIEKVSFQYAKEQVEAIFEKVNQLENYPLSGRPVPELKDLTIRQLLCGNYRIIYEVETEEYPIILTVHHQSRLLENNPAMANKPPES